MDHECGEGGYCVQYLMQLGYFETFISLGYLLSIDSSLTQGADARQEAK